MTIKFLLEYFHLLPILLCVLRHIDPNGLFNAKSCYGGVFIICKQLYFQMSQGFFFFFFFFFKWFQVE